MITIDQLLESVDLDFEPRWVTKNYNGAIYIWHAKPRKLDGLWSAGADAIFSCCSFLKLAEFENKDWQKCIYEVPRKTTGKIEKLGKLNVSGTNMTMNQSVVDRTARL